MYDTKREFSHHEAIYLFMLVLWLCRIFPRVITLNSNLTEKCYRIEKKVETDELPDDSIDIFQPNVLELPKQKF